MDNRFDELIERVEAEREIIGLNPSARPNWQNHQVVAYQPHSDREKYITKPSLELAKKWQGWKSITGLKPALECILMVNKPLSERTIVDNVLKHGVGAINVDACRIPFEPNPTAVYGTSNKTCKPTFCASKSVHEFKSSAHSEGRFPANLLVSDKALDTGKLTKSGTLEPHHTIRGDEHGNKSGNIYGSYTKISAENHHTYGDVGGQSRYFDLDAWSRHHGFLDVPKASKSERNKGLKGFEKEIGHNLWDKCKRCGGFIINKGKRPNGCTCDIALREKNKVKGNYHPTVKPIKLMAYLIELGCPPNGIVLDPFVGSGTTCISANQLGRKWIGIEINENYAKIARHRIATLSQHLTKWT